MSGPAKVTIYPPAPQEFRDGAGYGARTVALRLVKLSVWGIPLTNNIVRQVAEGVASEMGAGHTDRVEVTEMYQQERYVPPE